MSRAIDFASHLALSTISKGSSITTNCFPHNVCRQTICSLDAAIAAHPAPLGFSRRPRARERRLRRKLSPTATGSGQSLGLRPLTNDCFTQQRSLYVTVGAIAGAYALFRISKSNQDSDSPSFISGLISKWTPSQETFEQRNAIHTALMEKAAEDRHLLGSQGPREAFELMQPEYVLTTPRPSLRPC